MSISIHLRTEVRASVAEEDDGRAEKANQISLEFLEVQLRGLEPHVRPPHMTPIIPPPSYPSPLLKILGGRRPSEVAATTVLYPVTVAL